MSIIFLIISVTALVAFIIGLFNPGRAIFWSENKTKNKAFIYLVIGIVFGIVWVIVRFKLI